MKLLKVVFVFLFALSSGFMFKAPNASAEGTVELNPEEAFYDEELGAYVNAFRTTEDGLVPLSQAEHDAILPASEKENLSSETTGEELEDYVEQDGDYHITDSFYVAYSKFIHTGTTNYTGDPLKITADIDCTSTTCSIGHGVTYTKSVTVSYSGQTNNDKALIKSTLGISYTSAKASTSSFTFNLKKGQAGYIAFKPYKIKKSGYFMDFCFDLYENM